MGYFILAPVLLADYKSAIVTVRRRIANPPKQAGASILRRRSCGFEIRRQKRFDLFLCGFEIRRNWYFFVLAPLLEADCKSEIGNWRRIANPPKQAGASILRRRSCGFEIRRQKRFDLFLCGFEIRRNWYFFVLAPLLEADCKSEIGNWRRIANPPKQAGIINPR